MFNALSFDCKCNYFMLIDLNGLTNSKKISNQCIF